MTATIRFHRINFQIKAPQVRVIDETGKQLNIMPTSEAINLARSRGLDLIEVASKTEPPVCRIADFGKFQYQEEKKFRGHKAHKVEIKGIRLSFNIAKHDIEMKAQQAQKFLEKGDRIRVEIVLRGREKAFAHLAKQKLEDFKNHIKIPTNIDQPITKGPRGFYIILNKGKEQRHDENQ